MDLTERNEPRRDVSARRRPPGPRGRWLIHGDGTRCDEGCHDGSPPAEIRLETTRGESPQAAWAPPDWLEAEARRWANEPVLLSVSATDGRSFCGAMWQCLSRVRQIAPAWRMVLRTDGTGMASMAVIDRVLAGPFDEVAFSCERTGRDADRLDERGLMVIKQLVELRDARKQDRPIVVWLYVDRGSSSAEQDLRAAQSTARQIGVDRFEVVASSGQCQTVAKPWD